MAHRLFPLVIAILLSVLQPAHADDPYVRFFVWDPGLRPDANDYDKTDYFCAIALSPSTGKYAASCELTWRSDAEKFSRNKCNAKDAQVVVVCQNGWSALALGKDDRDGTLNWGVGCATNRVAAEQQALDYCRKHSPDAKVVFSIYARQMAFKGVLAYSTTTRGWGYSAGYGRWDASRAVKASGDPGALVFQSPYTCWWMALAAGKNPQHYGVGTAGNRLDAERMALEECRKKTEDGEVLVSFCTNGVEH